MEKSFFERNDDEVTKLMCKILLWMTLIFPAFFFFSITRIFSITVPELLRILPFGLICSISPAVLYRFGVKTSFLKNYSIIAVAVLIALMASNSHVGIYITYCLALALSCLYFDKKFTRRVAIIGYICLVVAVFFRSGNVTIEDGSTRIKWFIAYTAGYTMEYVAMSLVFVSLAGRARKLLENLHNTEQVQEILNHCGSASSSLSDLMSRLKVAITNTAYNNTKIEEVTDKTKEGCEHNLEQANQTTASIQEMDSNIQNISEQTRSLTDIANNSFEKTQKYIQTMNNAVTSMELIEKSSGAIQEQIKAVEKCSEDISEFAQTIASIAARTNILALNASIEAARAGEHGKGFAVVATQVGQLAEASKNATISITECISQMNESVRKAGNSVEQNGATVEAGIHEIVIAKNEAGNLLELQKESSKMVLEVEENLQISVEHQNKVSVMAESMSAETSHSLEQVDEIYTALSKQSDLTGRMMKAFDKVQDISDKLLTLSKQELSGNNAE